MQQRGFGLPARHLDVSALLGLNIGFERGSWAFWIADIALLKEP